MKKLGTGDGNLQNPFPTIQIAVETLRQNNSNILLNLLYYESSSYEISNPFYDNIILTLQYNFYY